MTENNASWLRQQAASGSRVELAYDIVKDLLNKEIDFTINEICMKQRMGESTSHLASMLTAYKDIEHRITRILRDGVEAREKLEKIKVKEL
jgi:hypothetical protein